LDRASGRVPEAHVVEQHNAVFAILARLIRFEEKDFLGDVRQRETPSDAGDPTMGDSLIKKPSAVRSIRSTFVKEKILREENTCYND